jgi:hypothetical protein
MEAQERIDFTTVDSLYREDQFYFGLNINLLGDLPEGVSQSGFAGGIIGGFIRDLPLNKRRNVALGAGIGFSGNTYGHNLLISRDAEGNTLFEALDTNEIEFDNNRFSTYILEVPLQFRWRTSTPDSKSFYRVYAGFVLGYMYHFRTNFQQEGSSIRISDVPELNRLRTGVSLSIGSNFVNFHFQYSLNSMFDGRLEGNDQRIGIDKFKFGLIFYIL